MSSAPQSTARTAASYPSRSRPSERINRPLNRRSWSADHPDTTVGRRSSSGRHAYFGPPGEVKSVLRVRRATAGPDAKLSEHARNALDSWASRAMARGAMCEVEGPADEQDFCARYSLALASISDVSAGLRRFQYDLSPRPGSKRSAGERRGQAVLKFSTQGRYAGARGQARACPATLASPQP